ncbi:uncharacterized protein PG998_014486 [Apiospora kogelbergensis]|uniref:uncharacterized protein n=1 Tax=Apiospora kogelbergensis TaxID=1337665 RepID=UPI00312E4F54
MADNSKKEPAQQKAKACHLLPALRLVEEAKESYSGFDYTAATQNLEALATDKTPDPQSPNITPDCCNALKNLPTSEKGGPTQKGNTYSEVLNKGQATTKTPNTPLYLDNRKKTTESEHTLVLLKDKDQALPRFDPVLIRDRINARLQCNAIKGVHASPKGNVVLTSLSHGLATAARATEMARGLQGWPITAAERPDTWPKLVAHFVPTSLSPTSFAEEVKRFNDIEIQGNVRWLSKPEGKAHSSMVFAVQEGDGTECLKNGIWIQGQHLQVVRFKSFTPKTQCRRCLKLGHDPVLCRGRPSPEVNPRFDLVSDPYMQVLEVITPIENFYIVNIYNQADEKGSLTVQRGDLNLHHPWWNPLAKSSPLAERLTCHLQSVQATLLIDHAAIESHGGTFHRPNSKRTSVIDLAFSIGFRCLHWQDWSYLPGTGSDHEAVSLERPPSIPDSKTASPQFCTKGRLGKVSKTTQGGCCLSRSIEEATNGSIPVKRPCDRSKAWWCPDLTVQRMRYHRAFRRYKGSSRDMETACKEARNSYFQAIDRAKTDHWFTFLAEANGKEIFTAYSYTKTKNRPIHTRATLRGERERRDRQLVLRKNARP